MDIIEEIEKKYSCDCLEMEYRVFTMADDRNAYVKQCVRCGNKTSFIKKSSIPDEILENIQPYDPEIRCSFLKCKRKEIENVIDNEKRKQDNKKSEWWDNYLNHYLFSEEWKQKRLLILERDRYLCQSCLSEKATIVHHTVYYYDHSEPAFTLFSLCRECHDKIHGRENDKSNRL